MAAVSFDLSADFPALECKRAVRKGATKTQSTVTSAASTAVSSAGSPCSSACSSPRSLPKAQTHDLLAEAAERLSPAAPAFRVKNTFIDDLGEEESGDVAMGRYRSSPARLLADGAAEEEAEDARPAVEVEDLEVRQPAASMGSVAHGYGVCKPCGWFWRPQGCANGAQCRHCHMCLPKDVRLKKKKALKAKKAALRR